MAGRKASADHAGPQESGAEQVAADPIWERRYRGFSDKGGTGTDDIRRNAAGLVAVNNHGEGIAVERRTVWAFADFGHGGVAEPARHKEEADLRLLIDGRHWHV